MTISGEIDVLAVPSLRAGFREAWASDAAVVIADLTRVSFLDGGGLTALISLCHKSQERGLDLVVRPSERIRRIARLAGADDALDRFDSSA